MTTTLAEGLRSTPVGPVRFAVDDDGAVVALAFADHWAALARRVDRLAGGVTFAPSGAADPTGDALDAYLAGDLAAVDGLRVAPHGTDFQRRVWAALRAIPAGATASYGDIARAVGAPRDGTSPAAPERGRNLGARAVGAANGANPVSIIVPCHRVIGSDGSLTGYGGGLPRKAWLLAHEARAQLPPSPKRHTPMALQPSEGGGQSPAVQQRFEQNVPLTR
jgi:methylated-DNA-[protein]-cysteine S-methyltransferase